MRKMSLLIEWIATLEDYAECYPVPTLFKLYFPAIYFIRIAIRRRVQGLMELRKSLRGQIVSKWDRAFIKEEYLKLLERGSKV